MIPSITETCFHDNKRLELPQPKTFNRYRLPLPLPKLLPLSLRLPLRQRRRLLLLEGKNNNNDNSTGSTGDESLKPGCYSRTTCREADSQHARPFALKPTPLDL